MRVQGTTLAFCALLGAAAAIPSGTADAAAARRDGTKGVANAAAQANVTAAAQRPAKAQGTARSVAAVGQGSRQARSKHGAVARAAAATPSAASSSLSLGYARRATWTHRRGAYAVASAGGWSGGGGISCVPYARMVTGMAISGNGGQWWYNAAGTYDRGGRPEAGSILAFRATGGMRSGHVAVVERVLGPRHVQIDHANWGGPGIRRGSVMRGVNVIDVSDRNDWSAVRVQVGHDPGLYGRVYPTYGFIYNRPDRRMMAGFTGTAEAAQPMSVSARFEQVAEIPELNPVPRARGTAPRRR